MAREHYELVCVHIRRGDHLEYEKLNDIKPLKRQYFLQAMDVYKENLKHPVFIIVTDDQDWAHRQIHRSFKPYYTGMKLFYTTYVTPLLSFYNNKKETKSK